MGQNNELNYMTHIHTYANKSECLEYLLEKLLEPMLLVYEEKLKHKI